MKRSSSSSDNTLFGRWDDDSNRPEKKRKHSATLIEIEDDADSITMSNIIPQSNSWVVTRFLGQNSYGSVYLAESTSDDSLPYEMVIKSNEISQASRLKREESFLSRLKSPFVVSCYGHEITEDKTDRKSKYYNTILEYCPGQSLAKHIQPGKRLAEEDVKEIARDVLLGLEYIHGEKVIHCDIKPKNILLSPVNSRMRPSGFTAKISGFGNAMEEGSIEYGEGWGHRRGTTRFMSPELIRDKFLDYGADVWAFGCTVLELLTGEEAWGEHGELDWEDWINVIGESDFVPYVPDTLSENAKDFVYKCLEKDPLLRCSVDTLLKHQFLSWNHELEEEDELEEEEKDEIDHEEVVDGDVEAYLQNREPLEQDVLYEIGDEEEEEEEEEEIEHEVGDEEEEEEDIYDEVVFYDEIGDEEEEDEEEEEKATEIDEEYPLEDSEDDL